APTDPAVVNQTGQHERKYADSDPIRLFSPEVCRVWIAARGRRAVDCYDAKNREREHRSQQKPVLAEQLSQKRRHATSSAKLPMPSTGNLGVITRTFETVAKPSGKNPELHRTGEPRHFANSMGALICDLWVCLLVSRCNPAFFASSNS